MVKNHGGNKAKKQGRKFVNNTQTISATRYSKDPDELYACCSKIFGNGMIGVLCQDGKERICIIRNKFRGRGKRGNKVEIGSWLLVGRRSFEKPSEGKKEKTDLLTVYSGRDVTNLKQKEMLHANIFKEFEKQGTVEFEGDNSDNDNMFELKFVDEDEDYYKNINLPPENDDEENDDEENNENNDVLNKNNPDYVYNEIEDDEINVDDI